MEQKRYIYLQLPMSYSMLGHNQTQMDSYNKRKPAAHGTLIANWYEQQVQRQARGEGRACTKTHVSKKQQQLWGEEGAQRGAQDDTKFRVLGETPYPGNVSENYMYGKSYNKADQFGKVGRKQQLIEQMYLQEARTTFQQQEQAKQQASRKGLFETQSQASYVQKSLLENKVGKLVMYDQNGRDVQLSSCDEDMRVNVGLKPRGQISSDQELKRLIQNKEGYEGQQPITFWREKLEDGTFYHSKQTNKQPFAKCDQFCRTFQNYKHRKD